MTREEVFVSLHKAHAESWNRQFPDHTIPRRPLDYYRAVHEWKLAWWEEMGRQFPEYIKNGVVCWIKFGADEHHKPLKGDVNGGRHNT